MVSALLSNLQHDIALLQKYIESRQAVGFHDMERLLEGLFIHILNATFDFQLTNKNQLKVNFPAIDLADDERRISVQVTTNASKAKIAATIDKFELLKMSTAYDQLYIVGFCKAAKFNSTKNIIVYGMDKIVGLLADKGDAEKIQDVIDAIRQHHDYDKIHPYDDVKCLEIVINCIDRNAVKHSIRCEGSYTDMVKGLNEITELITKGKIGRRSKSKSLDDYKDPNIRSYLQGVKNTISDILVIINTRRQGDFVYLNDVDMEKIDFLKREIIDTTINFSKKFNIPIVLAFRERYF